MKLSLSGTVFLHPVSGQKQFWDELKLFYCASSFSLKVTRDCFLLSDSKGWMTPSWTLDGLQRGEVARDERQHYTVQMVPLLFCRISVCDSPDVTDRSQSYIKGSTAASNGKGDTDFSWNSRKAVRKPVVTVTSEVMTAPKGQKSLYQIDIRLLKN